MNANNYALRMEIVGKLAMGVTYDLADLLEVVTGFAELVQRQPDAEDLHQQRITSVTLPDKRAADLVDRLLPSSHKQLTSPKVQDLNKIVLHLKRILGRVIGKRITLETSLAPTLWLVKVDTSQMEQLILNMAVNASEAMRQGGRLAIETANVTLDNDQIADLLGLDPGEYAQLTIRDNGIGMDIQVQNRIFEPFFTTKKANSETGLGLAAAFDVVRRHNGNILVRSGKGAGTTFEIYLPRSQESFRPMTNFSSSAEMPSGHEVILVVEDNAQMRELTRRVLYRQGYTVLEARNSEESLRLAAGYSGPIDLLLTEVTLSGMNGQSLFKQLTAARPRLRTLFMSGYEHRNFEGYGLTIPESSRLSKPFGPLTLANKVRTALDS